jgi:hypothetical protein
MYAYMPHKCSTACVLILDCQNFELFKLGLLCVGPRTVFFCPRELSPKFLLFLKTDYIDKGKKKRGLFICNRLKAKEMFFWRVSPHLWLLAAVLRVP